MHNLFVCKLKSCSVYLGTWDYLALNHYTVYFVHQSRESKFLLMDTGVADIPDDNYATAASRWLQVRRQGIAERMFRIALQCNVFNWFLLFYISWN
jgi:hypothetical protein